MFELPLHYQIIIWSIPVLFAITLHEVGHGWAAKKLGDPTAEEMGRLTINPLKHIDPIGTVVVPFAMFFLSGFVFGWAKPVPVNWFKLKNKKRDMALVALAGPAANLIMLLFWLLIAKLVVLFFPQESMVSMMLILMAFIGMMINALLMILNLFPLPPLDGSRVTFSILPSKLAYHYAKLEPFGLIIVAALLFSLVKTGKMGIAISELQNFMYSLI